MKNIITDRLIIRKFDKNDWQDLHEYLSDEEVVKYEPYDIYSEDQAKEEAAKRSNDESFYAVCLKENGKLIGNLYLCKGDFDTWELGFVFNRKYQGKGYATEGARALLDYAFTHLGARRIIAMCNPKNERSWKLLERLHMRREGLLLQNIYFETDRNGAPIWLDTYEYAILKEEWCKWTGS
ncbi:MAG: GNAT family N-acetyltransferase [Clostridiaceae bacterium]|nr:GNAT family N-acetyltransferase [Bacillota bacterium]NLI39447.1 GNAT family N-acetyltransferase [Clostridiaceae bacterium]